MRTRLIQTEGGLAIPLDAEMARTLALSASSEVEVDAEDGRLIVRTTGDRQTRLIAAAKRVMAAHDETFRKLAQ